MKTQNLCKGAIVIISILFILSCSSTKKEQKLEREDTHPLKYTMDMVYNNPGEKATESAFNDPSFLKEMGYNGMSPHFYVNCAITYDNFEKNIVAQNSEERQWIEKQAILIDEKLAESEKANIDVYPFTDIFVAPKSIWEKYGEQMGQSETNFHGYGGAVKNVRKPKIQLELIEELVRAQIDGIFSRFPTIDGLVIRFGETYLHDTPHHMGGSPLRQGDEGIQDHVKLLNIFREEICVKRNKKLFYRTWDFGWFHAEPDVYLAITNQVEPHENLIFSIKHTKGDFLRNFPFNPTLGIGKHAQIVEAQCQREYEGKGAHPNYVAEAIINGFEEYEETEGPQGLVDLKSNPNFTGVWTWSRGGGWRGPYITNELWCDLNAYVLSIWSQNTNAKEEDIFFEYTAENGLSDKDAKAFRKISLLSNRGVLLGRSSKIAHINPWWIRDQFMGGLTKPEFNNHTDEAWGKTNKEFFEIVEKGIVDEVLAEKAEAVEIWNQIEELASDIGSGDRKFQDYVRVSSSYGRIKYDIINQAWIIMLKGLEGEKTGNFDQDAISLAYNKYEKLWNEFKALKKNNEQCATLYLPYGFNNHHDELHKEEGMKKAVEKYFKKVQD